MPLSSETMPAFISVKVTLLVCVRFICNEEQKQGYPDIYACESLYTESFVDLLFFVLTLTLGAALVC